MQTAEFFTVKLSPFIIFLIFVSKYWVIFPLGGVRFLLKHFKLGLRLPLQSYLLQNKFKLYQGPSQEGKSSRPIPPDT